MAGLNEASLTRYGNTEVKTTIKNISEMLGYTTEKPHLVQQSGISLEANISYEPLLLGMDNHISLTKDQ